VDLMYREGSFGHLANGRRLRVLDAWVQAREAAANGLPVFPSDWGLSSAQEAMSVSDFPTYISMFLRHRFNERFNEITGAYAEYTRPESVEDFENYTSSGWGRFPDIPEKTPGGPYDELAIVERPGPSWSIREWGATFALTRKLIISDRLNELAKLPDLFSEAMARTVSKVAAIEAWQSNPVMWDGFALFSAQHNNLGSTALTADQAGMNALIAADQLLSDQTDFEGYPITVPGGRILLIPTELKWIANVLTTQQQVIAPGNILIPNLYAGTVSRTIIEPYWTDATNWYLASDLSGSFAPIIQVTLNGETTPFLGLEDPGVRSLGGGSDPYSFDFDQIRYKIRHNTNFVPVEWRGVFGSIVAG
jgi:hypothetical protein